MTIARPRRRQSGVDFHPLWPPGHAPTARQRVALAAPETEILYGGAAGGGKTEWLLMAGSQYADTPGYHGLIIRRTFPEMNLPGGILDRAREWWLGRHDVRYNAQTHTFHFAGGGQLAFGYLDEADSHLRYQGAELQFVGFDEAGNIRPEHMRYLASRTRRLRGSAIPVRRCFTANPGGIAHDWLKARFITAPTADRCFVPALIADNPYLDAENYRRQLAELSDVDRARYEHGDWDVMPSGGFFGAADLPVWTAPAPAAAQRCWFWDMAATPGGGDWTCGVLLAKHDGRYYVEDVRRAQVGPADGERLIIAATSSASQSTAIRMEQEPGSSGKHFVDSLARGGMSGRDFRGVPSTGPKQERARALASAIANRLVLTPPETAWRMDLLNELRAFPEGAHDDQVDALTGAFNQLNDIQPMVYLTGDSIVTIMPDGTRHVEAM